jgi:hypothetical protein
VRLGESTKLGWVVPGMQLNKTDLYPIGLRRHQRFFSNIIQLMLWSHHCRHLRTTETNYKACTVTGKIKKTIWENDQKLKIVLGKESDMNIQGKNE